MTYRERRERRADRLREWATKREVKAAGASKAAHAICDNIPLGQPILVGHHSQKRAMRDQDRIHGYFRKSFESAALAKSMASRAAEIDRQAECSIYSDDDDALENMKARIVELEAERDRMKFINAEIRKGKGYIERIAATGAPITDRETKSLMDVAKYQPYYCKDGAPCFPPYALSNITGNIARNKKRLPELEARAAQRERVNEALAEDRAEEAEERKASDYYGSSTPYTIQEQYDAAFEAKKKGI